MTDADLQSLVGILGTTDTSWVDTVAATLDAAQAARLRDLAGTEDA